MLCKFSNGMVTRADIDPMRIEERKAIRVALLPSTLGRVVSEVDRLEAKGLRKDP